MLILTKTEDSLLLLKHNIKIEGKYKSNTIKDWFTHCHFLACQLVCCLKVHWYAATLIKVYIMPAPGRFQNKILHAPDLSATAIRQLLFYNLWRLSNQITSWHSIDWQRVTVIDIYIFERSRIRPLKQQKVKSLSLYRYSIWQFFQNC